MAITSLGRKLMERDSRKKIEDHKITTRRQAAGRKVKKDRGEFVTQQDFSEHPKASPAISASEASFCKY